MQTRIALISEHASPLASPGSIDSGGQNVYVAQVAQHLARLGLQVDVFTRRDSSDRPLIYPWLPGVRVIHVPAGPATYVPKECMLPYMEPFADFMTSFIRQDRWRFGGELHNGYGCVHANFFMSAYVGCLLKKRLGLPLVVTFHALGKVRRLHQASGDGFPDCRMTLEEQAMQVADVLIAECPADRDDQVQLYQADPAKIRLVPCGFDASEVSPLDKRIARQQLALSEDSFTVLQLGRMVPRKGVDDVIRGFAIASQLGIDGRLIIVGCDVPECSSKSQELRRLAAIAQQLGVSDRVMFAGQRSREEIRQYYSACDVFVTAPWYEPFGITPLEAMACGRPVIGTNVGGIKFTIQDGITGYHVPPRDPSAIADKLLTLYQDRQLLDTLGCNALKWVNSKFTWRQVAEDLAEIYAEVSVDQPVMPAPLSSWPATAMRKSSTFIHGSSHL